MDSGKVSRVGESGVDSEGLGQIGKWKAGISIVVAIASALLIVHVFSSTWTTSSHGQVKNEVSAPPNEITREKILAVAQKQGVLTVGKIHMNASGWHREEKTPTKIEMINYLFKRTTTIRGWAVPCEIDVTIDMGKLKKDSFILETDENGDKHLTIHLPEPTLDERQVRSLQSDKLHLVISEGELEAGDYSKFQQCAFTQIMGNIKKNLDENTQAVIEMSKGFAAQSLSSFYTSLGLEKVTIVWIQNALTIAEGESTDL